MSKLHEILGISALMMGSVEMNQNEWKERILKEWRMSANYPRKKKKRVRKSLQFDWSFACWNPFDDLNIK